MLPQRKEQTSIPRSLFEGKRQLDSSNKNRHAGPGRLQSYLVTNRTGLQQCIKALETPRVIHRPNQPRLKDVKLLQRDDH